MEGLPQDLPEDAVAAAAALEAARKAALADQRLPGSTSEAGTASAAQVELWQRRGESGLDDLQRDVTEKPTELIIRVNFRPPLPSLLILIQNSTLHVPRLSLAFYDRLA